MKLYVHSAIGMLIWMLVMVVALWFDASTLFWGAAVFYTIALVSGFIFLLKDM